VHSLPIHFVSWDWFGWTFPTESCPNLPANNNDRSKSALKFAFLKNIFVEQRNNWAVMTRFGRNTRELIYYVIALLPYQRWHSIRTFYQRHRKLVNMHTCTCTCTCVWNNIGINSIYSFFMITNMNWRWGPKYFSFLINVWLETWNVWPVSFYMRIQIWYFNTGVYSTPSLKRADHAIWVSGEVFSHTFVTREWWGILAWLILRAQIPEVLVIIATVGVLVGNCSSKRQHKGWHSWLCMYIYLM
jgi:hypothetical protein